jgi:hypothetical protein
MLAHGRETEHRRAVFAILSFWAWYGGRRTDVRTVIFTDKPELFETPLAGLPIDYVLLTPERLAAMSGPEHFVHRVKVAIIGEVLREHPGDNVLFCDSDTFFVAESDQFLLRLQPGTSLLHQREYRLADAVGIYARFNQAKYPRKLLEMLAQQTFKVGNTRQRFRQTLFSWNSGVLGLTTEVAALMPDILALTDALYAGSQWIMCEQLAFSLALQATTRILPSEQYVFHYWGRRQKELMDGQLAGLLTPHFSEQELSGRLVQARRLSIKWLRTVELDKNREGALHAFANGELMAGVKCAMKALIAAPLNVTFAKELVGAITRRPPGRSFQRQSLRS